MPGRNPPSVVLTGVAVGLRGAWRQRSTRGSSLFYYDSSTSRRRGVGRPTHSDRRTSGQNQSLRVPLSVETGKTIDDDQLWGTHRIEGIARRLICRLHTRCQVPARMTTTLSLGPDDDTPLNIECRKFRRSLMRSFKKCRVACFDVIFLCSRSRIIARERIASGTVDHVRVYPRDVIKRALELDACGVILLTNCVSSCILPDHKDQNVHADIARGLNLFGIHVVDHFIVDHERVFSYGEAGVLWTRLEDSARQNKH